MKVSRPTDAPWVINAGLVVILVLLVGRGQKKIVRWLYYVNCKQSKDRISDIERECMNTERTMDCLSWINNTWYAKLGIV